ncbi:MAG: 30S ribosomal protein S12 methylthiotransferase RimO, partial [Cocleimonas sp.]|nr:30S ribosomal protein S12 methylthiotransferase RimO [Cocleimonas sp.]
SPVEGAVANELSRPVPEDERQDRVERFMQVQAEISAAKLSQQVGQRLTVLTDEVGDDFTLARSYCDAPEIDGVVYIEGERLESGQFAEVEITHASEHDLWGRLV